MYLYFNVVVPYVFDDHAAWHEVRIRALSRHTATRGSVPRPYSDCRNEATPLEQLSVWLVPPCTV